MRYLIILLFTYLSYLQTYSQCEPAGIPQFSSEILARSSGNDLNQPFISGEEVFIRISFNTNRDSTGRLMHGLIPSFGPGWDYDKINIDLFQPIFGYHSPEWFSMHEDCPPFVQKDIPTLCTYYDVNGNLQLCNLNCETCPCSVGLKTDDILPSGWFWNFQPASCIYSVYCPLTTSWAPWGVHISHNGRNITLDILLTVDTHSDIDSCEARKDLSIGIQEIYDDITGCWTAEEESVAVKFFTDDWKIDCTQSPTSEKFNKLKVTIYHDENLNGIRDDSEIIFSQIDDYEVIGDSIIEYSEYLHYYLLSGHDYKVRLDIASLQYDYALNTPVEVDVNFSDNTLEQEVEFGLYKIITANETLVRKEEYKAYPNPLKSNLYLEFPSGKHLLKLSTIKGEVIIEELINSENHTMDLSSLPNGIYYLSVYSYELQKSEVQKIIKN